MAVNLQDSNTRRNSFEGAVTGTTNIGGGAGVQLEPDIVWQGAQAWSRKISAGNGFWVTLTSTNVTTVPDNTLMLKAWVTNYAAFNAAGQMECRVGSSTTAYDTFVVADDGTFGDRDYPSKGGWVIRAIDASVLAHRDSTTGSPTRTAITEIALTADVGTSFAPNLAIDSLDFSRGLWVYSDDATADIASWQDFVTYDEGTISNRFGHVTSTDGVLSVLGKLSIGRDRSNVEQPVGFLGTDTVVVFPDNQAGAEFSGVILDVGDATSDINVSGCTFLGSGRQLIYNEFLSSATDINTTTDVITSDIGNADPDVHPIYEEFRTGDLVTYSKEGGTASTGLTDATDYYLNRTALNQYSVHTTRANAYADTSRVALSTNGAETHSFTLVAETAPVFEMQDTNNGSGALNPDNMTLSRFAKIVVNNQSSSQDYTNIAFIGCRALTITDINTGITGWTIRQQYTYAGEAFMSGTSALMSVVDFSFDNTGGLGHAMELTATGTVNLTNTSFLGYGADASTSAAIYNNSGGAVTINVLGGGTPPTVRNGTSATTTINSAVTLTVSGMSPSTRVAVIARETAGTVTTGDVLREGYVSSTTTATLISWTDFNYEAAFGISLDVEVVARNSGIVDGAILHDAAVITDYTTAARESLGGGDVLLTPAVPVVNDDFEISGGVNQFGCVRIDVTTAAVNTTITWEYWNGAWTALTVVDGTNGFTTTGYNDVSFTPPSDWTTQVVGGLASSYGIRARVSAIGGGPTGATASVITLKDTVKYLPFNINTAISASGMSTVATWNEDTTAR